MNELERLQEENKLLKQLLFLSPKLEYRLDTDTVAMSFSGLAQNVLTGESERFEGKVVLTPEFMRQFRGSAVAQAIAEDILEKYRALPKCPPGREGKASSKYWVRRAVIKDAINANWHTGLLDLPYQ